MQDPNLSSIGSLFEQSLATIEQYAGQARQDSKGPTVNVPNVGNALLFAYEQLRNASENIEDHLLFQSTIARFYKRSLSFGSRKEPKGLAHELIIELTQSEYLENHTVPLTRIEELDRLIAEHYAIYWDMLQPDSRLRHDVARRWILEILTVKTEQLFNNPISILSFAAFAHSYFSEIIHPEDQKDEGETIDSSDYPILLYIALHKALLRSNDANVRNALLDIYSVGGKDIQKLIDFNIKYDSLATLRTTARVARLVSRNGAPLRVLRQAFFSEQASRQTVQLADKTVVMERVSAQIDREYQQLRGSIRRGVIKSIIFLLLTKALIGLVVEIPYDLFITGAIAVLPLAVNLIFPPLFIAITALTFRLPSAVNKKALLDHIDTMLYGTDGSIQRLSNIRPTGRSYAFNAVFVLIFVGAFYLVSRGLLALGFNLLQGVIFFAFLSTASFLGYRLIIQIKELELVPTGQGFVGLLRDTLYAPFIFTGRRISYRFARMNIIAQILDIAIELPLTTILRLTRQWIAFLSSKQDDLL